MMKKLNCQIIRSSRKSMGLEIREGNVIVRAPFFATDSQIETFLLRHERWICGHLEQIRERNRQLEHLPLLTPEELRRLADQALQVIPERVRYYAPRVGVTYGRITIRNQRTRWGSCSSKGNLNFNCLLMLTPPEVIDSVVVHELCHRKEMNHSQRFYAEVLRVFPEYRKWEKWLKEYGPGIMQRMTESKTT